LRRFVGFRELMPGSIVHGGGFKLIEKPLNGRWTIGWAPDDDEPWPCYLEECLAVSWMRDRFRRDGVFR
jgi:hypothetical protein